MVPASVTTTLPSQSRCRIVVGAGISSSSSSKNKKSKKRDNQEVKDEINNVRNLTHGNAKNVNQLNSI